jgi:hypothetical protein
MENTSPRQENVSLEFSFNTLSYGGQKAANDSSSFDAAVTAKMFGARRRPPPNIEPELHASMYISSFPYLSRVCIVLSAPFRSDAYIAVPAGKVT